MKPYQLLFTVFLCALFSSCQSNENENLPTYTVVSRNFVHAVYLDGFVEPVNALTVACPRQVDGTITFLIEDGTRVTEGTVLARIEDANIETYYDQWLSNYESVQAELAKLQVNHALQYALMEAQVRNNAVTTEIAHLDSLQIQYASPNQIRIKELELQKAAIEKAKLEKKLQSLAVIQKSEILQLTTALQFYSRKIDEIKEIKTSLTIKASKSGVAIRSVSPMYRRKLQAGDNVWQGIPLVEVPETTSMKVKMTALESDYKSVTVGDSVEFTFDALPGNRAFGKITTKSPVGQPYQEGSKVKVYEMEASVDSVQTMPEPGFSAQCKVIIKQVRDTVVIPQVAVFEEDSSKVVYLKTRKGYQPRPIKTGSSSPKEIIVTEGLKGKEIIALIKPKKK
ncbi:MAG: hypothetical protein EZS26_002660 [Candidatus Ordinivivax streblomastigis]|uniref:CzcB-like C-terminal circularly permuted SH3-like domain-containing protein n=1 Tax=Candidatus Ordinivivax streblomastigis TaxID=2540710 RepID=A0A5M8NWJ4_9BACT|nr:MAG: hypothetical protein EZS26_002660 [Candidatus Ordinivivax streblomastigis]